MPAIPLDVLVAAHKALDRVMRDPLVPPSVKSGLAFAAGTVEGHMEFILRSISVNVVTIDLQASLLADLEHAVRFHDQLGPSDIARFKATIAMVNK